MSVEKVALEFVDREHTTTGDGEVKSSPRGRMPGLGEIVRRFRLVMIAVIVILAVLAALGLI